MLIFCFNLSIYLQEVDAKSTGFHVIFDALLTKRVEDFKEKLKSDRLIDDKFFKLIEVLKGQY